MEKSEQINELAEALAKVQAKIKPAPFDSVNPYFKSRYASLGSVIEVAKVIAEVGLSYSQLPVADGWYAGIENVLMHKSGQYISQRFMIPLDPDKNPVQEFGKAITYCRRYGLASMLGIYSDEDNDGNKPEQKEERKQEQKERKQEQKDDYKATRPYKPDELRDNIRSYAEKLNPATDKQRNLFAMIMSQAIDDKDIRHDVQEYLFGERSTNDIDGKLINSALKWMALTADSGGAYVMADMAQKELSGVLSAYLKELGQESFLE